MKHEKELKLLDPNFHLKVCSTCGKKVGIPCRKQIEKDICPLNPERKKF